MGIIPHQRTKLGGLTVKPAHLIQHHRLASTTPEHRAARSIQIRQLSAGIDEQMANAEALLLKPLTPYELRTVIDRIANLKVARNNLQIILDADAEH